VRIHKGQCNAVQGSAKLCKGSAKLCKGSAKLCKGSAKLCYGFIEYGYKITEDFHGLGCVISDVKVGFLRQNRVLELVLAITLDPGK
jgi:hypothetical protein